MVLRNHEQHHLDCCRHTGKIKLIQYLESMLGGSYTWLEMFYRCNLLTCRGLAPSTVSLTGSRDRGDDYKRDGEYWDEAADEESIWAASWKNQQSERAPSDDSVQPGHLPSLIRVFAVRMRKAWTLSYPLSAQRRLWSDWSDAQTDLSLRWAHSHIVGFVTRRLNYATFGNNPGEESVS